jgi:hypothetical protein
MAKNGKRGTRTPTPARAGDTLDNYPTFYLSRDLYESERKEVYTGILLRLAELKSIRKKTADVLGIPADQEREVSRVIALYEGDTGILALFQNADEEEEYTEQEVKKGGKDKRQRELPIDKVPSESTEETRASSEPVGVAHIDDLVSHVQPIAPSDLDWDAFRREVLNMSKDERFGIHEYVERVHQYQNAPPSAKIVDAPSIPGHLHALFTDLSPAYAKALGGREDVIYPSDMARAMARAEAKKRAQAAPEEAANVAEPPASALTGKQLAALRAIAEGHAETVSASMYRKLVSLGLAGTNPVGQVIVTSKGWLRLGGVLPGASVLAGPSGENPYLPEDYRSKLENADPLDNEWGKEILRNPVVEVEPIRTE